MTASEVLDLAATAPVRRRFGFDDDDLGAPHRMGGRGAGALGARCRSPCRVQARGVRPEHLGGRARPAAAGRRHGRGSRRWGCLGSAAGGGWLGLALPLDDVDSSDIELVGRLAELVERLHVAVDALRRAAEPWPTWISRLVRGGRVAHADDGVGALAGRLSCGPSWRRCVEAAGDRADAVTLTLADLRVLLADRLRGRPTRANFRTGSLTMCTLVPMRSVPHRVVCLIGLDDGAFPRQPSVDGDDILLRDPMTGERDERSEDRQLLLDAVLAAREQLVITYSGADERTNALRPPAVPVGELLDTLDAAYSSTADERRAALPAGHPPSAAAVRPGELLRRIALGVPGAVQLRSDRSGRCAGDGGAPPGAPGPTLAAPLRAGAGAGSGARHRCGRSSSIRCADSCASGSASPCRAARRRRATGCRSQLNSLERWQIGQRMLDARLSGVEQQHCRQAEWRRGALPPGRLGARVLDDVASEVEHGRRARPADGVRASRACSTWRGDRGGTSPHRHRQRRLRRRPSSTPTSARSITSGGFAPG